MTRQAIIHSMLVTFFRDLHNTGLISDQAKVFGIVMEPTALAPERFDLTVASNIKPDYIPEVLRSLANTVEELPPSSSSSTPNYN